MNTFGTDFILVTDVRQELPAKVFAGGPWIHLATVKRGFKEYVCFTHKFRHNKTYIEEIDIHNRDVFIRIEEDNLWKDLYHFLLDRGCLTVGKFKQVLDAPAN
jgi:hypothetical protein